MKNSNYSTIIRISTLILTIALIIPICAMAATDETMQPRASSYLSSYNAYVYSAGGGLVQVYFNVQGTGTMDELGALTIKIYECSTNSSNDDDWTWKKTIKHDTTSGMLSYSDDYHSGHVDYNGTVGKYYKAYVCVWGGKDGSGDTRYFWTTAKIATQSPA